MNKQQLRVLEILKESCAAPVVVESSDEQLKAHLRELALLATYLMVDQVTTPQLRKRAMASYAELLPTSEALLGRHKLNTDAARELARLCAAADPEQFDACLAAAHQVQHELASLAEPEARALYKNLALIEGSYCKAILAAMNEQSPFQAGKGAAAAQVKAFDAGKLHQFLIDTFPDEQGLRIAEAKFISGGSSKYTMLVELEGARSLPASLVLRGDSASSANFGGASAVDEFRLLQVLHRHGVCVAQPIAAESSGKVFGSPFMLVEKRPGTMIGHMFSLPPANAITARDVAQKLAAIHRVPLGELGDWVRGAQARTSEQVAATLESSYANWQALQQPSPMYAAAFKWLRENVDVMDRTRGLVHGDFGLNNLLIDDGKVSAILDWEFFHIGNPAYDLGYFYYQAESLASWQEFLDAYAAAGGILPSQEELDYSILFAATRLGVMVDQAGAAFRAGLVGGLFIAVSVGRGCHEMTHARLHDLLEKLL
jgi:aminoglycoside phosphotransferase (APT) family kinase protein